MFWLREVTMYRIMLVADEPNVLRALERLLKSSRYTIESFAAAEQALRRVQSATFDLALADYRMPGMDGVTFLTRLREVQPDTMRLIISGHTDWHALLAAVNQAEIYRFLPKPWDDDDLKLTVERALEHRAVLVENRRLAEQVRRQQTQISRQEAALRELERTDPEIARVTWGEDGSVLLDNEEQA